MKGFKIYNFIKILVREKCYLNKLINVVFTLKSIAVPFYNFLGYCLLSALHGDVGTVVVASFFAVDFAAYVVPSILM